MPAMLVVMVWAAAGATMHAQNREGRERRTREAWDMR
jgi:hypothetical protein